MDKDNLNISTKPKLIAPSLTIEKNCQHKEFVGLDTEINKLDFIQCDFRGASFNSCKIVGSDFSMSDFCDTTIRSTQLISSKFGPSAIQNCFFEKADIKKCKFHSTSFWDVSFIDSEITDTSFVDCDLSRVEIRDSILYNTEFSKTRANELTFIDSEISDIDFSPMHGVNFSFSNCKLQNILIDMDYLGGYLFNFNPWESLKMNYKEKIISFKDAINETKYMIKHLIDHSRFSDALNISILRSYLINDEVNPQSMLDICLNGILNIKSRNIFRSNLSGMFRLLKFYMPTGTIGLFDVIKFIDAIHSLDKSSWEINDILYTETLISELKILISMGEYKMTGISSNETALIEFIIDENDEKIFLDKFNIFYNSFVKSLVEKEDLPPWKIVARHRGSLFIYITVPMVFATFIPTIIDKFHRQKIVIETRRELSDEILRALKEGDKETLCLIADAQESLRTIGIQLNTDSKSLRDEAKGLFGIIKLIKIIFRDFGDGSQ